MRRRLPRASLVSLVVLLAGCLVSGSVGALAATRIPAGLRARHLGKAVCSTTAAAAMGEAVINRDRSLDVTLTDGRVAHFEGAWACVRLPEDGKERAEYDPGTTGNRL